MDHKPFQTVTFENLASVNLYMLHIEAAESFSERYCTAHFPERLAKAKKFHFKSDTLRCIGVGVLIYEVLYLDEKEITIGSHGKPCAKSVNFSISHSGDYIILAVCNGSSGCDVGADIEKINEKHLSVCKTVFTDEEILWLKDGSPKRFFQLWTMKESVSKALGLGLQLNFKSFSALPLISGEQLVLKNNLFCGKNIDFPGYSISVCVMKNL